MVRLLRKNKDLPKLGDVISRKADYLAEYGAIVKFGNRDAGMIHIFELSNTSLMQIQIAQRIASKHCFHQRNNTWK